MNKRGRRISELKSTKRPRNWRASTTRRWTEEGKRGARSLKTHITRRMRMSPIERVARLLMAIMLFRLTPPIKSWPSRSIHPGLDTNRPSFSMPERHITRCIVRRPTRRTGSKLTTKIWWWLRAVIMVGELQIIPLAMPWTKIIMSTVIRPSSSNRFKTAALPLIKIRYRSTSSRRDSVGYRTRQTSTSIYKIHLLRQILFKENPKTTASYKSSPKWSKKHCHKRVTPTLISKQHSTLVAGSSWHMKSCMMMTVPWVAGS